MTVAHAVPAACSVTLLLPSMRQFLLSSRLLPSALVFVAVGALSPTLFAGDCNNNGIDDSIELSPDCDGNGVLDECETLPDMNGNGTPDICEDDCNGNGVVDIIELLFGLSADCNGNLVLDECDTAGGMDDCDFNGVPDSCQVDCDGNGLPDVCEPDCDFNGVPDVCELLLGATDCNANGIPDSCDEASGVLGVFSAQGVGLAGSGGFVPAIETNGCPAVGITFQINVTQGLGGASGVLFLSSQQVAFPFVGGTLYIGSPVLASIPHVLLGAGEGNGTVSFPFTIPVASLAGVTLHAQAGYLDVGAVQGLSLTSSISVVLPTL